MIEKTGYKKVDKLNKLINLGLNVFEFKICSTFEEVYSAIEEFDYVCTIRTDTIKRGTEIDWLYPFYIIENFYDTCKIDYSLLKKGYKFIIANGLKYDKSLRMNICYKLNIDGSFLLEYSQKQVPLRKMYSYPECICAVHGNLDEELRDWIVYNNQHIDLRELRSLLREEYLVCLSNGLFNKYIELSVYYTPCGIYNKDKIYWEI